MLHELLPLLPARLTGAPTDVLAWTAAAGALFGFVGARFSRAQVTLAAVAAGAGAGMRFSQALHWPLEPMCLGVVGAMALGVAAYLFHRTVVAVALGALLAGWAVVVAWIERGAGATWNPSGLRWSGDTVLFLTRLWQSLPGDLGRVIPVAGGAALAGGVLTGLLWPRLSRCLLYGVAGPTLTLATALPLTARLRPEWLEQAPSAAGLQVALLIAWVAAGLMSQWRLSRVRPRPGAAAGGRKRAVAEATVRNASPAIPGKRPMTTLRGVPSRSFAQPVGTALARA